MVFKNQNVSAIRVPMEILITAVVSKKNLIAPPRYAEKTRIATQVLMLSNVSARLASLAIRLSNVSVSITNFNVIFHCYLKCIAVFYSIVFFTIDTEMVYNKI